MNPETYREIAEIVEARYSKGFDVWISERNKADIIIHKVYKGGERTIAQFEVRELINKKIKAIEEQEKSGWITGGTPYYYEAGDWNKEKNKADKIRKNSKQKVMMYQRPPKQKLNIHKAHKGR